MLKWYAGKRRLWTIVPLTAVLSFTLGATLTASAADNVTYYGCLSSRGGVLYNVNSNGTPTCLTGDTSITWSQMGPQGPQGPQGPAGVSGYEMNTAVYGAASGNGLNTPGSGTFFVYCSSGKVPLGGGYVLGSDQTYVTRSWPVGGNGWGVHVYDPASEGTVSVFVYVMCANAS